MDIGPLTIETRPTYADTCFSTPTISRHRGSIRNWAMRSLRCLRTIHGITASSNRPML
jgi:hypothetical protein